jgi:acetyl esterase
MKRYLGLVLMFSMVCAAGICTEEKSAPQELYVYKTVSDRELQIRFSYPDGWTAKSRLPVFVFFFGGGWTTGSFDGFQEHTDYFVSRGLVVARVDYRIKSKDGVMPDKCVEDARSSVRWIRQNADKLGVDGNKLIASGGSAGGHLAACTAIRKSVDAETDDMSVSSVPQALVLYNPVMSFFGIETLLDRIGGDEKLARKISPTLHLHKDHPPTIIMFGTEDKLKVLGDEFRDKGRAMGVRVEEYVADGVGHTFFRRVPWDRATMIASDKFMASLGFIEDKPTIEEPTEEEFRKGVENERKRTAKQNNQ